MRMHMLWPLAALAPLGLLGFATFAPDESHDLDYMGNDDVGQRVAVDKEGAIYVAGTAASSGNGKNYLLAKYGPDLTLQWIASYHGPGELSDDIVTGLVLDNNGTPYVCGYSQGNGTGYDVAVKAFNPLNGQNLWPTSGGIFHNGAARYNSSGSQDDFARDMTIDISGNLLVCGDTDAATQDALLIVFEPDGDIKSGWPVTYGSSSYDEFLYGVSTDASNNLYAAGSTTTSSEGTNILVLRYTGSGTLSQNISTNGG